MKYYEQFSGLLPAPEVKKPTYGEYDYYFEYDEAVEAHKNWLSKLIRVLPKHADAFKGLGDVELKEGIHYEIKERFEKNPNYDSPENQNRDNPIVGYIHKVAIPLSQNEREETRPNIKDYFKDISEAHNQYLASPELFAYTQALDRFIDEREEIISPTEEQKAPSLASHSCTPILKPFIMSERYPSFDELERIKNWDSLDAFSLIEFITCRWAYQDWGVKKYWDTDRLAKGREVLKLELHTAGWSGNESLIDALLENRMFTMMWYESWRRGGHHYFEINPFNVGFMPVMEFAKKEGVTKQAIHKDREKYEWLDCGNKKLLVRKKKDTIMPNRIVAAKVSDTTTDHSSNAVGKIKTQ